MGRRDAMSRMVVVTLPEDQVNQLEFLAKKNQPDWKRSDHDGSCGAGCPPADQADETKR